MWEYLVSPLTEKNEITGSFLVGNAYYRYGILDFSKLGKEGWELVTVDDGTVYFKRPIQTEGRENYCTCSHLEPKDRGFIEFGPHHEVSCIMFDFPGREK